MEAHNIRIENIQEISSRGKTTVLSYDISMDTAAGTIAFSDETGFVRTKNRYLLLWNDGMILPDLTPSDKVSAVSNTHLDVYKRQVRKSISRIFCDDLQTEKVKNILYGENG